jgi:ABC-type anion transport system duplicated permease subunit
MIFRPLWIFPLCLVILDVVLGHDGYYQVLQVMTRDYYHSYYVVMGISTIPCDYFMSFGL